MPAVLHSLYQYLELTNTFIYDQLQLPTWQSVVVANSISNRESFPHSSVETFPYLFLKHRYFYLNNKWKQKLLNILPPYRIVRPWVVRHFRKLQKQYDLRVMHAHFGTNAVGLIELSRILGMPLVTSFYGFDLNATLNQEPDVYRELFEHGSLFLVEGPAAKQLLTKRGYPGENIVPHGLGICVENFPFQLRKIGIDKVVKLLMVARFVEKKGIPYLLQAMERVKKKCGIAVQLTLIGDGPMKQELLALHEQLGLQDIVHFKGIVPYTEMIRALLEHHIFVHPSVTARDGDTEGGAPIILLNAQATGMPVIATKHADIPQEVLQGKSGVLVEERDVDGLANAILLMAQHPEMWEAYGRAGRDHVEKNYDAKKQNAKLEKLYELL